MKKRANVALIIETSGVYGRHILRGISRFTDTGIVSGNDPAFRLVD